MTPPPVHTVHVFDHTHKISVSTIAIRVETSLISKADTSCQIQVNEGTKLTQQLYAAVRHMFTIAETEVSKVLTAE